MTEDEVVREVRTAREAFAASHGYDIQASVAALREFGATSGREVVRLAPRPVVAIGHAAVSMAGTSPLSEVAPAGEPTCSAVAGR